jgi:hypothetical protein
MLQYLFVSAFLLFSSSFFLGSIKFIDEDKQALVTRLVNIAAPWAQALILSCPWLTRLILKPELWMRY